MAALASTSYLAMRYRPMRVPVLPKPALQWTAIALPLESSSSHRLINLADISFGGFYPSGYSIFITEILPNSESLYIGSDNLTTVLTPFSLKNGMKNFGGRPLRLMEDGLLRAMICPGRIQDMSPSSSLMMLKYSSTSKSSGLYHWCCSATSIALKQSRIYNSNEFSYLPAWQKAVTFW
jgi:hypothetical protein